MERTSSSDMPTETKKTKPLVGSGDLQGLRRVGCAGGETSRQPSQTINVCLKKSVMMGSNASALLLYVSTVSVYHCSSNGLRVLLSLRS